ncbi:MAG: Holliday junction branch migration protein RuvA [Sphaerochaetaceae bacterium]|jgi:Holliday junction DNA helicase RuvA
MIHAIKGEVVHVTAQQAVIRTTGGLEFELIISSQCASKLSQLNMDAKREVRLLCYLQHRDDMMNLYGFSDEEERLLFMELIKVNGIGPRQALKILGAVQVRAFVQALDDNDIKYLSSIPGVGPKTSQKIVLALRDTIVLDVPTRGKKESGDQITDKRFGDLVAALVDMGYDKRHVITALEELQQENKELLKTKSFHDNEEFLFKNILIRLG